MAKLSTRAVKNKMEKFKKQQMYGDTDVAELDSSAPKFTFDLQKSISTRELVNPQLSRWDKEDLLSALRRDPDFQGGAVDLNKIPKYMIYDMYSWFYNPMNTMKMGKVDDENKWQYNILKKLNNIYLRTATEKSLPHSYLVASEYTRMMYAKIEEEQKKDPNKSAEDILKDWSEQDEKKKPGQQSSMDQAIQQANQKIEEKMQDFDDKQELVGAGGGATKESSVQTFNETTGVLEAMKYLKSVRISNGTIQDFIKTSLKLSSNHFSSSYQETEESIFDADEIEDLAGLEYLMPQFKFTQLEDITTSIRKYNLNFDIYIDNSGSMDASIRLEKGTITAFDMCKITALKIVQLGYGKDIYIFNNDVYKMDLKKVLYQKTYGGTQTERVIDHIVKTGRPGLILTDMCDSIQKYTKNAYFIGINGANFTGLRGEAERYLSDKQVMVYQGGKFEKAIVNKKR
jgi:hypothetical protein